MAISTEGKLSILLGLLGLGGAGAIMIAPEHKEIGWAMIGIAVLSGVGLGMHHFQRALTRLWLPSDKQRMIALICMIVSGLGFVGSAGVYFWPKPAPPNSEPKNRIPSAPSTQAQVVPSPEPPLPTNAKFRYHGNVYWVAPRQYTKEEANDMRTALREVYDCISSQSTTIVSNWDGPLTMFTREWFRTIQSDGPQAAEEKLNAIRNDLITADKSLKAIMNKRPYYQQDLQVLIDERGVTGDLNGALNDYIFALRAIGEKPNADLMKLTITPYEAKLEQAADKYRGWIGDFNTKMTLLRDELEKLMNN